MRRKVYDWIRKIDNKEEKIKRIIEKSSVLNALELYMLVSDFEEEDVWQVLKAIGNSLNSFSLQSLMLLFTSEKYIMPAFLCFGEKLERNELVTLINRIEQPLVKLQVVKICKGNLFAKDYLRILKHISNPELMEKFIALLEDCPLRSELEPFLDGIKDENMRQHVVELFLVKFKISPEKISLLKAQQEEEKDFEKLFLPEKETFGVELEFEGVWEEETFLWDYLIGGFRKEGFQIRDDVTLNGGSEIVTPILRDTEESWRKLYRITRFAENIGGKVTENCGTHIHFGADVFEENPQYFRMFLKIWQEVEPLLYMVSNKEGEIVEKNRRDNIKPIAHKIQEMLLQTEGKEVSIKDMITMLDMREKGFSVNLRNIVLGDEEKYTVEFRLPNGTLDYQVIRENVDLYGRLLWLAKELVRNPEYQKEAQESFFRTDVNETQKLKSLLELLFEEEEKKKIYLQRLHSVKEEGFVIPPKGELKFQPSFIFEEMQKIARIVPGYLQEDALSSIIEMTTQRAEKNISLEH